MGRKLLRFILTVACVGAMFYRVFWRKQRRSACPSSGPNGGDPPRKRFGWQRKYTRIVLAITFAGFMLPITLFWNERGWVSEEDRRATWVMSVLRDVLGQGADNALVEEFSFVNVSGAVTLTPDPDNPGAFSVVTDRAKLGQFFELLSRYPNYHRFIVCNVLLDQEMAQDSLLREVLPNVPNLIAASIIETRSGEAVVKRPVFDVDYGISHAQVTRGLALRMRKTYHVRDSMYSSLTYKLYKRLHSEDRKRRRAALSYLETFYVDPVLQPSLDRRFLRTKGSSTEKPDIGGESGSLMSYYINIEDIILMNNASGAVQQAILKDAFEDKIIVIGDFVTRDMHASIMGEIPGSLLTANAYLALREGNDALTIWLVLVLWIGFTLTVYPVCGLILGDSRAKPRLNPKNTSSKARLMAQMTPYILDSNSLMRTITILFITYAIVFALWGIHVPVMIWILLIGGMEIAKGIARIVRGSWICFARSV